MAWKVSCVMEERLKFIAECLSQERSMAEVYNVRDHPIDFTGLYPLAQPKGRFSALDDHILKLAQFILEQRDYFFW